MVLRHTSDAVSQNRLFIGPLRTLNVIYPLPKKHYNQPSDFRVMVGVRGITYQPITAL